MKNRINKMGRVAIGALFALALAGGYIAKSCSRTSEQTIVQPAQTEAQGKTITYEQLEAAYINSPEHLAYVSPGRTISGLTSDTTLGVPLELRVRHFMKDNFIRFPEIEAGKSCIVHSYTNNALIKD